MVLDVLRGFALFGILLVNFRGSHILAASGTADRIADAFINFFASGSFYPLFSFLFGFGFAMQIVRAEMRKAPIVALYVRRLLALLVIGTLHSVLIWRGDILQQYAVIGFLLLLFRKLSQRMLLVAAAVLLVIGASHERVSHTVTGIIRSDQSANAAALADEVDAKSERAKRFQKRISVAEGTYAETIAARAAAYDPRWLIEWPVWEDTPIILAMFLLGLYAGRRRLLQDPNRNARTLWVMLRVGLAVGVIIGLFEHVFPLLGELEVMRGLPDFTEESWARWITANWIAGDLGFTACYIAALTLWAGSRNPQSGILAPFAAVGRMGLTNYLLISVLMTWALSAYGLGLGVTMGSAQSLILKVVVYALLIALSLLWLRAFQYGPAEWAWRSLTYLRPQPMLRRPVPVQPASAHLTA